MYSFDHFQICQWHGSKLLDEVFQWAAESNRTLRNDYLKLKNPFCKTTAGQNSLSFLGPSKWNQLPESTKSIITLILSNIILKNLIWHNLQIK